MWVPVAGSGQWGRSCAPGAATARSHSPVAGGHGDAGQERPGSSQADSSFAATSQVAVYFWIWIAECRRSSRQQDISQAIYRGCSGPQGARGAGRGSASSQRAQQQERPGQGKGPKEPEEEVMLTADVAAPAPAQIEKANFLNLLIVDDA